MKETFLIPFSHKHLSEQRWVFHERSVHILQDNKDHGTLLRCWNIGESLQRSLFAISLPRHDENHRVH